MELFNTILRKILYPKNTTEELYNTYAPKPKPYIGIFTTKLQYNDTILIYKNPKYKDFLFYLANAQLFYNTSSNQNNSEQNIYTIVSAKYNFLKKNIHTFMENINNDFIDLFRDAQKHYIAFAKFANIWKYKRFPVQIDHDLYMTPLVRTNRSVFSLLQQGKIYLFTAPNLVNIACASLSNAPNFFPDPLVIKNPYNNIALSKSDLYNIYFFLKQSPIIMPTLFHNYFLLDFDLRKFSDENENVIKNVAFKSYIRNASAPSLYYPAIQMLKKYCNAIVIDKEFPKETLINILRPYLLLYYIIQYSSEEYRICDAEEHLKHKLKRLYDYNPAFGRKMIKINRVGFSKKIVKTTEFNNKHPYFDYPIDMQTYQKTHLEMVDTIFMNNSESNNNEEDSDDEEPAEEDDVNGENHHTNENDLPFVIISPHPSFSIQSTLTVLTVDSSNINIVRESEEDSDDENEGSDEENTVSRSEDEVVIQGDTDEDDEDDNDDEYTW
uniref:Uncharacterized protein n=1 Tax=viral metagenome TaxID=1070528 RepID=A0A6C0JX96_9ZZZZ